MAQRPPKALRVLFLEDSPDDLEMLSRELIRHGFECESKSVESRAEFLGALKAAQWDVILSDHSMRGFTSIDALHLLHDQGFDIPFIIISGTVGEDSAVDAMRAGAHDYVLKQNLRRLGPAVERELREAANRRMQKSTQAALMASEQRLRHAQKMESVGRLAAGIAHDFNNLLTVILGFTEFLIERLPPDEDLRRDAAEIRAAASRAAGLTKQLLAFSRQQVLDRRVVDLVDAVNRLRPMITRLIGADVALEFDLATPPQLVLIDPGQFEQVLMNLIVNARDAMPGGGRLRIAITRQQIDARRAGALDVKPGAFVTLSVTDTGEGIEPEALESIFEPFFTTKAPGSGTGLGLSTVFGIIRQSGGAIEVDSAPRRGSTFRAYFPLSAESAAEITPPTLTAPAGMRSSTILLAEDEQGVRTFLEMALRRAGHTVITSQSGSDAVAAGKNTPESIDLLITDVVMPGLSGPQVADQLRRLHPNMRVLFLSGHSALPDNVTSEPGAFLQKPFTVETLMSKVRERLLPPAS
jgi:two-component system, cell cycle sensor histidine kinase and response regulator CckA